MTSLLLRISGRLRRECLGWSERACNVVRPTFLFVKEVEPLAHLFEFLNEEFLIQLKSVFPSFGSLVHQQAERSLKHQFDLLGSGLCKVAYGMPCGGLGGIHYDMSVPVPVDARGHWLRGRINARNLAEAQRIWRLIEGTYVPIDWQLDFKSGFRWAENIWHRDIRIAHKPGVDVKVPWELARLQHLPTLAMAAHFSCMQEANFRAPEVYACEFRNQVLDFIATNPPGFGVNWVCAMDVAIRVANLLVARDIFIAAGVRFDAAFETVFVATVKAHARHVIANLEWSPRFRGNHYLADILGLLFSAIYLPCDKETDAWLCFATRELLTETAYQFHEDGSNFEASVCYHRLSAEMVLWGAALLSNLAPDKMAALARSVSFSLRMRLMSPVPPVSRLQTDDGQPLPEWFWERMARMADFTEAMTRPDDQVVQFGDNDSGRFLLLGSGEQLLVGNDPSAFGWSLDHHSLIACIRSMTGEGQWTDPCSMMVSKLAGARRARLTRQLVSFSQIGENEVWDECMLKWNNTAVHSRWSSRFDSSGACLTKQLQLSAFPGMGCYIMRSPDLYLAIRCGEIGLAGLGAHAHCDQLAIELVVAGKDCIRDPGTFIYTAFPEERNRYRSALAHHVPRVAGREPANLELGVFDLRGAAEGECLYFGPRGFIGRHAGYGSWVYRIIALQDNGVEIFDFAEGALAIADPQPLPLPFSAGYGRIADKRGVVL